MRTRNLHSVTAARGSRSEPSAVAGRLRRFLPWSVAFMLLLLAAPNTFAQTSGSATLRGTVKDPTGAVVSGATVTLVNEKTQTSRSVTTESEGTYVFTQVDPDVYTIRVEAANFKGYQQTDLRLSPSDTRGQDITLEVGLAGEVVNVETVEQIQTETGEKSSTITAEQIQNLSLIGRSSLELLRVLPGVVPPDQSQMEVTSFGGGANNSGSYSVNGLRGQNNSINIDGSRVIDIGSNSGTIITANNDMVQEVKVQTSNYLAEYGSSAVQISAVTKSGGQDFHGALYWYTRPWWAAANERSRNYAGQDKPHNKFNYPGGNIGGPIVIPGWDYSEKKDKLFFFYGLEFQRQLVAQDTRLAVVPTALQRQGDFSEFLPGGVNDPENDGGSFLNQPIRNLLIPGGFEGAGGNAPGNNLAPFIDPIGLALINLYPQPTGLYENGRYNYATNASSPTNRTDQKLRVDWKPSEKASAYVRLARESEETEFPFGIWWTASNYELPSPVIGSNLGRSAAVGITTIISPTMVNEVVFSASRLKLDNDYRDPEKVTREALGIDAFTLPFGVQTPYAAIDIHSWGGTPGGEFWSPGGLPLYAYNASYSVNDTLSKVEDSHTMKFGVFIERGDKQQNFNNNAEGDIVLGAGWIPGSTGTDFGDLLVGRPAQLGQDTKAPDGEFRFWNIEGFAQDSWKVKPNFTLEYGVRISYFPNNYERNGLGAVFDPTAYIPGAGPYIGGDPQRPNGILLASRGEIEKGVVPNPPVKFGPRVGFAWDITGEANHVIRGGVGVFYNRVQGNYQYDVLRLPPNAFSTSVNAYQLSGLTFTNFGTWDPFVALGGFSPLSQDPHGNQIPRIVTGSLSVAERLPFDQVLELSYVSTYGRHLPNKQSINFLPAGTLQGDYNGIDLDNPLLRAALDDSITNRFRPYPDFSDVIYSQFNTRSNYQSLQVTLTRQQAERVQYFVNYTFSKALGHQALNEQDAGLLDPLDNRGRSYGILNTDRTHVLNASYVIGVPDLAEGWADNWAGRGVFNGWKVSGITTISSGVPLRIAVQGDYPQAATRRAYQGSPNGTLGLVYLGDPSFPGGSEVGEFLLRATALALPGIGDVGTFQAPYNLRSPARMNTDITLFKTFNVTENQRVEFRTGIFNIFNQAFANPNLGDIELTLQTACNTRATGVPNGVGGTVDICDPRGGYSITNADRFGRINTKHGRRVIEFAVKYLF
jgi:hypothetical protein